MQGPQGTLGIEGRVRVVQHDVRGMRGSGPDGSVQFEDLWTTNADGMLVSRHPERVQEDRTVKNKFTKRGLGYLLYQSLLGLSGTAASKQPTDITSNQDRNPFQAFMLIGDNALVTPTRPGDGLVEWAESDTAYDAKITGDSPDPAAGTAQIGKRGLLLSTTSGILKRVQIRYPNSSPNYEQCEYTFFAQANSPAVQTGYDGLDDFIAKSIALSYGLACGYNEANSQIGTRAVLGIAATHQGVCDRNYVHEFFTQGDGSAEGQGGVVSPLHVGGGDGSPKYFVGETIDGDGYVTSAEASSTTLGSITGSGSDAFVAATKRIKLVNAPTDMSPGFVAATHVRQTLIISGSASNDKEFTIKRVVAVDEVEVFETVISESGQTAAGVVRTFYRGLQAFDGRVENEGSITKGTYDADPDGTIVQGGMWESQDVPGGHHLGRIWNSAKTISGIRIVVPKGSIRDFCPNRFLIQTLTSGNPEGGTWTTQVDKSSADQASLIFDGGEYGYEYVFPAPVSTQGVRLFNMQAVDTLRKVEIGELYIFTQPADFSIASPNNVLRYSRDSGTSWRDATIEDVAATKDVQDLVDAVNKQLTGWGVEVYRSTFGFLWFRATVAGDNATLDLDTTGNGSTINANLGLPTAGRVSVGVTVPLIKAAANALTLIYTLRMGGDFAKPYEF